MSEENDFWTKGSLLPILLTYQASLLKSVSEANVGMLKTLAEAVGEPKVGNTNIEIVDGIRTQFSFMDRSALPITTFLPFTEAVYVNGVRQQLTVAYVPNPATGTITFNAPPSPGTLIEVDVFVPTIRLDAWESIEDSDWVNPVGQNGAAEEEPE